MQLYRGFICGSHPEDQQLAIVDKIADSASGFVIKEWRRLPKIASAMHVTLLQVRLVWPS